MAARLPAHMLPHAIRVVAALPLTANGKVDRKALLALAEASGAQHPAPSAPANAVERALIERWTDLLGSAAVFSDSTFVALGGDSLSYIQVFLATEEVIGVVPPRWQFAPISELAQSVRTRSRIWTEVDLTVLVRAVSIFLIISGHFHLIHYGGGAVSAMMLVSGFTFRRAAAGRRLRQAGSVADPAHDPQRADPHRADDRPDRGRPMGGRHLGTLRPHADG